MNPTVKKVQLSAHSATPSENNLLSTDYQNLLAGLTVSCTVRIGTFSLSLAELKNMSEDQEYILEQQTSDPVEILINNQVVARGELMCHEDCFAVRITEVHA